MFVSILMIGIGATLLMDLWSVIRKVCFGIPYFNYGLVGRWAVSLSQGKFVHENIMNTQPATAENVIGWILHYVIGITFVALHFLIWGNQWLLAPTLVPALATGVLTVVFPFFLMQPCLGFGIAASKAPNPSSARVQSLITHTVFGLGIWISALLWALP